VVFAELLAIVRAQGVAAVVATHNPELAARMDRVVTLRDGRLV
jgi:lipoprotein-releasing system ATP-binding protein